MTDLRKAAEMALEAFEMYLKHSTKEMIFNQIATARAEALRQALAQDALRKLAEIDHELGLYIDDVNISQECVDETAKRKHEPVAFVTIESAIDGDWRKCPSIKWFDKPIVGPLYTTPPKRKWVGLTDEEKDNFWKADQMSGEEWDELFAEVEAKLKEKNT